MVCEEVSSLSPEDTHALFHGRKDLWGSHGLGSRHLQCQKPTRRFLLRGDLPHDGGVATDMALCHVGVGQSLARVVPEGERYGHVIPVWGVGGVVTRAGQEGRGHASRLLAHVLQQLTVEESTRRPRQESTPYAILFCLEHRKDFYANRGWLPVPGVVTVEQPPPLSMVTIGPPYYAKYLPLIPDQPNVAEVHLWSRPW